MKGKRILLLLLALSLAAGILWYFNRPTPSADYANAEEKVRAYAEAHGLSLSDYPKSLIELLERNPETEKFVLEYPTAHTKTAAIDLSEYDKSETVPLFLQWDQRWGYQRYGNDVAGITGCGPLCLSMVAYHLTRDNAYSPDKMLTFALEGGYYVSGSGSSWTLISEGAVELGFSVQELPLDEGRIRTCLEDGIPVICAMGPGDFTSTGHFIVLTGWEDGGIRVNDPNSTVNSKKLWSYDKISGQIRNLWGISVE